MAIKRKTHTTKNLKLDSNAYPWTRKIPNRSEVPM